MQPKDRRLVTESNLETELDPVKTTLARVDTDSQQAVSRSRAADQKADNAVTRVEHIETMAGLTPGEVTDAQTANLIQQSNTFTRTAFSEVLAHEMYTEGSPGLTALDSRIEQRAVTGVGVTRIVASTDPLYPLEPGELLVLLHDHRPTYFYDFSSYPVGTGAPDGWERIWDDGSGHDWRIGDDETLPNGRALISEYTDSSTPKLIVPSEIRDHAFRYADQEVVVKHKCTGSNDGAVVRATGTHGDESGYFAGDRGNSRITAGHYIDGLRTFYEPATPTSAEEWYITRLRVEGGTLMSRHWLASAPEPTDWIVTAEDLTMLEPGDTGIRTHRYGRFAWVGFGFDGARAPKGPEL